MTALTAKEQEVLELAGLGLSNQEIGCRLGIALQTVKNHLHSANKKLSTKKRQIAFAKAMAGHSL